MSQLNLDVDPLLWSVLAGIIWSPIQAALDKPWWTANRRRVLVLVAALVLGVVIWFAGAYPLTWELIISQAGVILGAATAAFTVLKKTGAIDWIGRVTPGGETTVVDSTAMVISDGPVSSGDQSA